MIFGLVRCYRINTWAHVTSSHHVTELGSHHFCTHLSLLFIWFFVLCFIFVVFLFQQVIAAQSLHIMMFWTELNNFFHYWALSLGLNCVLFNNMNHLFLTLVHRSLELVRLRVVQRRSSWWKQQLMQMLNSSVMGSTLWMIYGHLINKLQSRPPSQKSDQQIANEKDHHGTMYVQLTFFHHC